jgi:hypothetical protein
VKLCCGAGPARVAAWQDGDRKAVRISPRWAHFSAASYGGDTAGVLATLYSEAVVGG